MGSATIGSAPGPRVVDLQVADDPEAWTAAGFAVDEGGTVRLGSVLVRLDGSHPGTRGITGWTLAGVDTPGGLLDGLATTVTDADTHAGHHGGADDHGDHPPAVHPNGVTGLDHLVVLTPDLDRTLDALAGIGLELRRIRDTTSYGSPMRQAFFRLGPTILEVVSGDTGTGLPAADAPATFFGLAVDVADLDATAAVIGDGLGPVKAAVQDGRRIATLRHRHFGMSVAVAAMDDHADR